MLLTLQEAMQIHGAKEAMRQLGMTDEQIEAVIRDAERISLTGGVSLLQAVGQIRMERSEWG